LSKPKEILQQYWGHTSFRPMQEDIINAVLSGKDVLALLPTGGGKSVCFQVPALLRDGVCVVVTPLIALMKDQVNQLKKRNIPAIAIYSGMSTREIDMSLDNCVYGNVKFLYISPERLKTELFLERVKKMKVCLLAIDEAHCISQWGYDFRPPYLEIAQFRKILPGINVVALTATATREVKEDIQQKLEFTQGVVFQKSFVRENLSYAVREDEGKERKLVEALERVPGSAIVYVRSRKKTKEIALLLLKKGIKADFYHAGLDNETRAQKQEAWTVGNIRVMVATNAFGMGIDKPDVRLVVHMDLPDSLEAYYQEAGRAGRDENTAYALVICHQQDIDDLTNRVLMNYPSIEFLRKVYQCLANYYKMAVGSSQMTSYDFLIDDFCQSFRLNTVEAYQAIKKLEEEGFVQLNESFYASSKLVFNLDHQKLYEFQIAHAKFDLIIKAVLRLYGGELFAHFCHISEFQVARLLNISVKEVVLALTALHNMDVVFYDPQKDKPQLTFLTPRLDANKLPINIEKMNFRKERDLAKAQAVIDYVKTSARCRTQMLLEYFDELTDLHCGVCDFCVEQKRQEKVGAVYEKIYQKIRLVLMDHPVGVEELMQEMKAFRKNEVAEVVRKMIDCGEIKYQDDQKLALVIN
jgi:ATP-dependent DNA helicase RecQ